LVVAGFSLRTLKGAATLKIQCDTAFTEHLPFIFVSCHLAEKENIVPS